MMVMRRRRICDDEDDNDYAYSCNDECEDDDDNESWFVVYGQLPINRLCTGPATRMNPQIMELTTVSSVMGGG